MKKDLVSIQQIEKRFIRNYKDATVNFKRNNYMGINSRYHYEQGRMDAIVQGFAEVFNWTWHEAKDYLDRSIQFVED